MPTLTQTHESPPLRDIALTQKKRFSMSTTGHTSQKSEQAYSLSHAHVTPTHKHTQGHIVYPASGVLSIVTEAGSWIAPSNRLVWIPAGYEHQHKAHGLTDMRVVFMSDEFAAMLPPEPAVFAVSPLAREALISITNDLERNPEVLNRWRQVVIDDLQVSHEQPLHLPEPKDERLKAIARILEHDLATGSTLAGLGRQVGASERTLSRLFHNETGMGFRQWRTQLRIHRALLLLNDGVSVTNTAIQCGWTNPSAFIDAFENLVGQTPGHYQRSLRS